MKTILTRSVLILSLLLLYNPSFAAKYYFSSSGDDSRTAAQAQNESTPWKSISKLNAIFKNLQPGDEILFKRGDTFYGTIHVSRAGSNGRPIVIGAYGVGNKPVITSLVNLTNWKSNGNGIYESSSTTLGSEVNVVLLNGKVQEIGRYPNRGASNGGYLQISSNTGNASVSSSELSTSANFSGGEVVIRKNQWIIDRHKISNHSGTRVNYQGGGQYHPAKGFGFFIQRHLNTLDQEGEWFYNPSGKKLNVFLGSKSPSSNLVQAASLDHLLTNRYGQGHFIVKDLHFKGANKDAIHIAGGSNIKIENNDIEFSGENGILSMSITDLVIDNNRVNHSFNNGIFMRYGNEGARITNNLVENTFMFPGGAQNGDSNGVGIYTLSNNSIIEYNQVKNTGYSGIHFGGNSTLVKNNLIDTYCVFKNDGGGIYTNVGTGNATFRGRRVEGNIILNGVGSRDGIPEAAVTSKGQAQGIFLDDNTNGVEIVGNTISNAADNGLKVANSRDIVFRENTVFNSTSQIVIGNSARGSDTRNINISNNILVSKYADQMSYTLRTDKKDIESLASFSQNYLFRPMGDRYSIALSYNEGNKIIHRTADLKRWQKTYNKDQGSSTHSESLKTFEIKKLVGENIFKNGLLEKTVAGLNCNDCLIKWVTGLLSGGSAQIESPAYSSVVTPIGSVKKDKNYILKFTAFSSHPGALKVLFRHAGSPWEVVSPSTTVELGSGKKEYSILLKPYEDIESTALMFISDEKGWKYWMDDIELKEAEVEIYEPRDYILFEYNASKTSKTVTLDGTYVDVKNKAYSGSVTLAPYTSLVLIRTSKGTIPKPEVSLKVNIVSPSTNHVVTEGSTLNLKAEATASNTKISKVEFFSGKTLLGTSNSSPYTYNWERIPAGDYSITAVVTDTSNKKETSEAVALKVNKQPQADEGGGSSKPGGEIPKDGDFPMYFNVGSGSAVKYKGLEFSPSNSINVSPSGVNQSSRSQSSKEELFQSVQFAPTLNYSIDVPNGTYTVQTYHNETYFGYDNINATAGLRVFDILIEGKVKEKNLDLFVKNGNKETVLTFENIVVTDGKLDLSLIASENNASISGIAVYPFGEASQVPDINLPKTSLLINTGSTEDVQFEGNRFISDYSTRYFTGNSNINRHLNASTEELYRSHRFAPEVTYQIPVANGTYTIITYHNETYFEKVIDQTGPGRRVFDIYLEGELVKNNLDLYVENANQPTALTFNNIQVSDGVLNLELKASVNSASISGIAVINESDYYVANGANLRTMIGEPEEAVIQKENQLFVAEQVDEIKIYPNPAKDIATLSIGKELGRFTILVHNLNGQLLNQYDPATLKSANGKFLIPVSQLENGVYIVTIAGEREIVERIRLIVAP